MDIVKFKLMRPGAKLPKRGTDGSGAFDFYAPERTVLQVGEKKLISSGIAHDLPGEFLLSPSSREPVPFCYLPFRLQAILFDRSGLGGKKGVRLSFACLIDNDYRGEIKLSMENLGTEAQVWEAGDRLCQILYVLAYSGGAGEVEELSSTARGEGGFGSTGV